MNATINGTTAAKVNEKMNADQMAASYNPDNVKHVKMYADNVRYIWEIQDETAHDLAEEMRNGLTPDPEKVANSEAVRRIAAAAKKAAAIDTWCKPTAADMAQVRREIAAYIIDELATWKVKNDEK